MSTLNPPPQPTTLSQPKEPGFKIKVLWKWSFLFLLVLVAWGAWQCGSGFRMASRLSEPAVQQFHQELDAGQYEAICGQAAEGFCGNGADGETVRFLKGVHEKLGNVGAVQRGMINVNANTGGTFVTIQYNTSFALGPAQETFTWIKGANTLRLYRYSVQSNALFTK
jgi:hypothetical protein